VKDWNGREIRYAVSSSGVIIVEDYRDNLIMGGISNWPPLEIVQKLVGRRGQARFMEGTTGIPDKVLGYYCDLQSLNSEDAITWSYFGVLSRRPEHLRIDFLNALCGRLNVKSGNHRCDIELWRRLPHPDKPSLSGSEIDFSILGDEIYIIGEAKWRSREGKGQGVMKNKSQIQLRKEFLEKYSSIIFGQRESVLLYISLDLEHMSDFSSESSSVKMRRMTWSELATIQEYPNQEEFQKYYDWKKNILEKKERIDS